MKSVKTERFVILTGKNLSKEKYLATWELDNRIFEKKDQISKKMALDWFEWSGRSTIVLWDKDNNCLVGYITPYLVKHSFANKYILNNASYKDALTKDVFCLPHKNLEADIYLFSTVVAPQYRDKKLEFNDQNSKMFGKSAFKVLNEALVDWVCDVKLAGVSINYIFGERVTDDGERYLRSLELQPCFAFGDECKFAKLFTPSIFHRCSNVNKLFDLYKDESLRTTFDKNILNNHEYLSIKDNVLYYKDVNLYELANKYYAPLEVAYTPMIGEQIRKMKSWFADEIKSKDYTGKYYYAYATKANYYSEVVVSALNEVDMLETSSAYDIYLIIELAKQGFIKKGYTIICNGFKNETYINNIKELLQMGIHVIPIIENEREFELLSALKNFKLDVGLRYNSDFESRLIKHNFYSKDEFDNRYSLFNNIKYKKTNHVSQIPSYGILFDTSDGIVYFSGDTSDLNNISDFINNDIIISKLYVDTTSNDVDNNVHVFIGNLNELIPENLRDKVYCMHINDKKCIDMALEYGFNVV